MLAITGNLLSTEDKRFIRYATIYTLDYLMPNIERKDYKLLIDVAPKGKRDCMAECAPFYKAKKPCRKASVWVNETFIHSEYKTVFNRIDENFRKYLFHELVHVKQYMIGELKDLTCNKYMYKGVMYKSSDDDDLEGYYMAPYEMEARAYEDWLNVRFRNHLNVARGLESG